MATGNGHWRIIGSRIIRLLLVLTASQPQSMILP